MNDYINYYDLLGVSKDCTKEEIRKAYIKQIKKWHPDINKDDAAIDITRKLNDAKEIRKIIILITKKNYILNGNILYYI